MRRLAARVLLAGLVLGPALAWSGDAAESDQAALKRMREEITRMIGEPRCVNLVHCRVLALGSRPCGGADEYVAYSSTTADREVLEAKAYEYTFLAEEVIQECRGRDLSGSCRAACGLHARSLHLEPGAALIMPATRSNRPSATQLIPSLGVLDIGRSMSFYREFFGFELEDSYEDEGSMSWCWLKARGADLMLQQLSEEQQITLHPAIGQSWVIYIRVEDLSAVHGALKKAGLTVSDIARTPYGASEFFVTDPDGDQLWVSVPAANGNGDDDEDEDEEDEPDDDEDEDEEEDDDEEEEWQVDPVRPKSAASSRIR